MSYFMPQ